MSTHLNIPRLGRQPGTPVYRDLSAHPDDELVLGVLVIGLDGGLFFATADALEDRIRTLVESDPTRTGLVLDARGSTSSTLRARRRYPRSSYSLRKPASSCDSPA